MTSGPDSMNLPPPVSTTARASRGPAANFDTCPGKVEQSLDRPEVADQDQPVIVADARRRVVTEQVAAWPERLAARPDAPANDRAVQPTDVAYRGDHHHICVRPGVTVAARGLLVIRDQATYAVWSRLEQEADLGFHNEAAARVLVGPRLPQQGRDGQRQGEGG
jgi:hypothetical protein